MSCTFLTHLADRVGKESCLYVHNLRKSSKRVSKCTAGVCQGFLKGGSNISWFPKKRSSDFKGGANSLIGGGVQYISLPRSTNLAYLDTKE